MELGANGIETREADNEMAEWKPGIHKTTEDNWDEETMVDGAKTHIGTGMDVRAAAGFHGKMPDRHLPEIPPG